MRTKTKEIRARVAVETKALAEGYLAKQGMTLTGAVRLFVREIVKQGCMPLFLDSSLEIPGVEPAIKESGIPPYTESQVQSVIKILQRFNPAQKVQLTSRLSEDLGFDMLDIFEVAAAIEDEHSFSVFSLWFDVPLIDSWLTVEDVVPAFAKLESMKHPLAWA